MNDNDKFWKSAKEINEHAEYVKAQAKKLVEELAEIDRQFRERERIRNRISRWL